MKSVFFSLTLWLLLLLMSISTYSVAFDEAAFISGEMDDANEASPETSEGNPNETPDAFAGSQDTSETAARPLTGSDRLKLYGRFENQLTLSVTKDHAGKRQKHLYDYLQMRLDMDARLTKEIELKSDMVARLFAGETEFQVTNLVPPQTVEIALTRDPRLSSILLVPFELKNRYWLDNAYAKVHVYNALLTIGKQPLGQGAGYVWNPTDVFTQKDLLDPTYQQEGIVAARLGVPMGKAALDLILASPDDGYQNWMGGGRFQFPLGPFQFSAASYYTRARFVDIEGIMNLEDIEDELVGAILTGESPKNAAPFSNKNRYMFGGDVVVDIKGVRLWGEAAYNYLPTDKDWTDKDWFEADGGIEFYFPFETHLILEYFYYEKGPLQVYGSYNLNAWMNVLEGNYKMLGQHFLFESLEHPVADYWSLGVSSFQGLSDGSAVIEADIKWDFAQNAQLWIMAAQGLGGREDFLTNRFQTWLRMTMYY